MMAKKLGSPHVFPLNHKTKNKLMKRVSDKKKRLFNKVFNYLKSDLYMFGPLLSSHSQLPGLRTTTTTILSTSGVEANEPCIEVVRKKELVRRKVGDYLKTDCYMYAPLVTPNPCLYAASNYDQHYSVGRGSRRQDENTGGQSELLKKVSRDREKRDEKATTITNEDLQMKGDSPRRSSPILRHTTILQQETLKHIVHRKRISPSVPGKGSVASEARKPVARSRRL